MTPADLQKVRSHVARLDTLLPRRHGDDEALLEFRRLCWAVLLVVDDQECQDRIDHLVQHAKDLFSGGSQAAQPKIKAALSALSARLNEIEGGYGKRWRDLRAA